MATAGSSRLRFRAWDPQPELNLSRSSPDPAASLKELEAILTKILLMGFDFFQL